MFDWLVLIAPLTGSRYLGNRSGVRTCGPLLKSCTFTMLTYAALIIYNPVLLKANHFNYSVGQRCTSSRFSQWSVRSTRTEPVLIWTITLRDDLQRSCFIVPFNIRMPSFVSQTTTDGNHDLNSWRLKACSWKLTSATVASVSHIPYTGQTRPRLS